MIDDYLRNSYCDKIIFLLYFGFYSGGHSLSKYIGQKIIITTYMNETV